mgnify:CR=1 FL=1
MPGPASPLGAKVNAPPVIGGAPTTLLSTETRYDFQPSASDPDADPLRFSALNLPPWASLDPATGRISGQPGPMDAGLYGPITLSVSDGAHQVALPDFEIRVETAPARGRIKLAWQLPSTNEDGSAINQVLLTRIYFGRGSRAYQGAYTVPGPGTTKYVLKGLQPGTWYVATTAVDPEGLESVFSDETVALVN